MTERNQCSLSAVLSMRWCSRSKKGSAQVAVRGTTETRNWARQSNSPNAANRGQAWAEQKRRRATRISQLNCTHCTSCISMAYAKLHDRRGRRSKALLSFRRRPLGSVSPLPLPQHSAFLADLPSPSLPAAVLLPWAPAIGWRRGISTCSPTEAERRTAAAAKRCAPKSTLELLFCMAEAQSRRREMMLITNCLQGVHARFDVWMFGCRCRCGHRTAQTNVFVVR
ncbi:hypothetical protein J3F84DRAFT_362019 [Trichoderma pleuroticola]